MLSLESGGRYARVGIPNATYVNQLIHAKRETIGNIIVDIRPYYLGTAKSFAFLWQQIDEAHKDTKDGKETLKTEEQLSQLEEKENSGGSPKSIKIKVHNLPEILEPGKEVTLKISVYNSGQTPKLLTSVEALSKRPEFFIYEDFPTHKRTTSKTGVTIEPGERHDIRVKFSPKVH